MWIREWASGIRRQLGRAYDTYANASRTGSRARAFSALTDQLDMASDSHDISGSRCLDLLGLPDLWLVNPDGTTGLVYFFMQNNTRMEVNVQVSKAGERVTSVGWNVAGTNDYGKLGYHP
jgi:hypothetical protein